jgi:ABC-type lipoprotein release transport system permease subunit
MWPTVAAVVLAAPLLSVLASWLPAVEAARQDPAAVLREE